MITISSPGSFKKTDKALHMMSKGEMFKVLDRYGQQGVNALSSATPIDTGETAHSWGYELGRKGSRYTISYYNTHRENDVLIAVIIQYGHGTGTGGYVQGIDYINPVVRPIFDRIVEDIWRQVTHG